jgi:hypothetical protein
MPLKFRENQGKLQKKLAVWLMTLNRCNLIGILTATNQKIKVPYSTLHFVFLMLFTSANKYLGNRGWQRGKTHEQSSRHYVTPEYSVHVYNKDKKDL